MGTYSAVIGIATFFTNMQDSIREVISMSQERRCEQCGNERLRHDMVHMYSLDAMDYIWLCYGTGCVSQYLDTKKEAVSESDRRNHRRFSLRSLWRKVGV